MNGLACAQRFQSLTERKKDQLLAALGPRERLELLYWISQYIRQMEEELNGT